MLTVERMKQGGVWEYKKNEMVWKGLTQMKGVCKLM